MVKVYFTSRYLKWVGVCKNFIMKDHDMGGRVVGRGSQEGLSGSGETPDQLQDNPGCDSMQGSTDMMSGIPTLRAPGHTLQARARCMQSIEILVLLRDRRFLRS